MIVVVTLDAIGYNHNSRLIDKQILFIKIILIIVVYAGIANADVRLLKTRTIIC